MALSPGKTDPAKWRKPCPALPLAGKRPRRCGAVSHAAGSELNEPGGLGRLGGCCAAPAAFGGGDNPCSQPLSAIFATLLGAHLKTFLFQNPERPMAASSRLESLSRGLGMEGRGALGPLPNAPCCACCSFKMMERGVGLTPGLIPLFQASCFATSVSELPLWRGAQGFWCHSYPFQQRPGLCTVCNSALLARGKCPPLASSTYQPCQGSSVARAPVRIPGCSLQVPACLPVPCAGPGQYA